MPLSVQYLSLQAALCPDLLSLFCWSQLTVQHPCFCTGAISAARDLEGLRERGVTHVLNASPVVPCFYKKHLRYHVVHILDDPEAQIHKNFQSCNSFIHKVSSSHAVRAAVKLAKM